MLMIINKMKRNYSLIDRIKTGAKVGTAVALSSVMLGCSTARPYANVKYQNIDGASGYEGKLGVIVGGEEKSSLWEIVSSPVRGKQWRKHPWRTSFVTLGYIGVIALASGGGGGGGSSSTPATTTTSVEEQDNGEWAVPTAPTTPTPEEPAPIPDPEPEPDPDDGGGNDGGNPF